MKEFESQALEFIERDFRSLRPPRGRIQQTIARLFGSRERGITAADAVSRGVNYNELLRAAQERAFRNSRDYLRIRAMGLFALDCVAHAARSCSRAYPNDLRIGAVIDGLRQFIKGDEGLRVVRNAAIILDELDEASRFDEVKMSWLQTSIIMQRIQQSTAYVARTRLYEAVIERCLALGVRNESEAHSRLNEEFQKCLVFIHGLETPYWHQKELVIDEPTPHVVSQADWKYLGQVMHGIVYRQYARIVHCSYPFFNAMARLVSSLKHAMPQPDRGWYHLQGPKYERDIGSYCRPFDYRTVVQEARKSFVTCSVVCNPLPNISSAQLIIDLMNKLDADVSGAEAACRGWEFARLQLWLSGEAPEPISVGSV